MQLLFFILLLLLVALLLKGSGLVKKQPAVITALPPEYIPLLEEQVAFYRALDEAGKKKFAERMASFLSAVTIEGIRTPVEDIDKVLIAASAVIPIFGFPEWHYNNLTNVLLYPNHFNESFELDKGDRRVMGMVGSGDMNRTMILSKPALYEGFRNETDKSNTAIHEFVHLLDKMDGDTDGVPQVLLEKQYCIPWINRMHEAISEISSNRSDINPYGATSKTEFFAVAAEYFFERPDLFRQKHPDLYALMAEIFDQHPVTAAQRKDIGRNDPCPCGSGKKYKHCHGENAG